MSLVFSNLAKSGSKVVRTTNTTCFRFYRKPRWIPTAKSKLYRNIERRNRGPVEEVEESTRLVDNHKIYSKSLWAWQKQVTAEQQEHFGADLKTNEDMEVRRIIRDNEEVNVRVKCQRDEELVEEWVQVVQEIEQKRRLKENDDDQRLEIAKKKMLSEMEKLKSIINLDDLDIAIESALSSEVDYNFAIDKSGNVISGRNNGGGTSG